MFDQLLAILVLVVLAGAMLYWLRLIDAQDARRQIDTRARKAITDHDGRTARVMDEMQRVDRETFRRIDALGRFDTDGK